MFNHQTGKEKQMTYIARYSEHIQEDMKRNWSSWNFGEEGINATETQIENWKQEAIDNDQPFYISGFELWGSQIESADIRELYEGYWVLVDNVNGYGGGIFGTALKSNILEEAIKEASAADYSGEGVRFNANDAVLIKSIENGTIHIFQINDD